MEKVSSANEKLDALLTREEVTKIASQKMIDVLDINLRSKLWENGKWAAQALENKRIALWKKFCRQDKKAAKLLEGEKAEN